MGAPPELTAFYAAEYERLVGILSLYCGDRLLAQELAQETFVRVCRDWNRVKAKDNPRAWMHRVAINLTNSYFRRRAAERRARRRHDSLPQASIEVPDADMSLAVKSMLAKLSKRQRAVLVLRYYADLPFSEIASVLGCPEPTARSLARRGLKRLRKEPLASELREVPNAT